MISIPCCMFDPIPHSSSYAYFSRYFADNILVSADVLLCALKHDHCMDMVSVFQMLLLRLQLWTPVQ